MMMRVNRTVVLMMAVLGLFSALLGTASAGTNKKEATIKIEGTITQLTKDKITIRVDKKDYELALDGKNTCLVGKPAVDKKATAWYKEDKGNLWATKIEVAQDAKSGKGNAAEPEKGKVEGTIAQYAPNNKITIRVGGKEMILMLDGKHTTILGKPAVDQQATVWYKKDKGNLWATKIELKK